MFKHADISTQISKGAFYFTLVACISSLIVIIVLLSVFKMNALAIFAAVMMFIIFVASVIVLFGMISDYAYIDDDILYMSYLFKKSHIKIAKIKEVKLIDNIYHIYDLNNNEVGTINALAIGVDKIINFIDK